MNLDLVSPGANHLQQYTVGSDSYFDVFVTFDSLGDRPLIHAMDGS